MPEVNELAAKVRQVATEVKSGLFEMDEVVDTCARALVSSTHVSMIGRPGCAKSLVTETWVGRIVGARSFVTLVGKTTVPDQLFGPPKVSALKLDRYERNITGKVPDVEICFLDEFFKAPPSISNSLLRIMNERKFENDGYVVHCPLVSMFGASNEYPPEECDALWDRFQQRVQVEYVRQEENFLAMLRSKIAPKAPSAPPTCIGLDDLKTAIGQVKAMDVTDSAVKLFAKIRENLMKEAIDPSPRRWCDAVRIMQANAWLRGAPAVDEDDFGALVNVLWIRPEDKPKVQQVLAKLANPVRLKAEGLFNDGRAMNEEWARLGDAEQTARCGEYLPKLKKAGVQLANLVTKAQAEGRSTGEFETWLGALRTWHKDMVTKLTD